MHVYCFLYFMKKNQKAYRKMQEEVTEDEDVNEQDVNVEVINKTIFSSPKISPDDI